MVGGSPARSHDCGWLGRRGYCIDCGLFRLAWRAASGGERYCYGVGAYSTAESWSQSPVADFAGGPSAVKCPTVAVHAVRERVAAIPMGHAKHPRHGRHFALVFAGPCERIDRGALAFKQFSAKPMAGQLGVRRSFAQVVAAALGECIQTSMDRAASSSTRP